MLGEKIIQAPNNTTCKDRDLYKPVFIFHVIFLTNLTWQKYHLYNYKGKD